MFFLYLYIEVLMPLVHDLSGFLPLPPPNERPSIGFALCAVCRATKYDDDANDAQFGNLINVPKIAILVQYKNKNKNKS